MTSRVGDLVRVDLHGRRVGGWVVAVDPPDALEVGELKPIAKVTGRGPSPELVELAEWAAVRWAGRRRHFLVSRLAGPGGHARSRRRNRTGRVVEPRSPASTRDPRSGRRRAAVAADERSEAGDHERRRARADCWSVVPSVDQAMLMGAAIRRAGLTVAVMPHDWAAAAGGVDVVIGGRSAAWAPCPGLAAVVVVDEHDEALQEEGSPTWHARDVGDRARPASRRARCC